jgi:hypothetical protein
MNFQADPPLTAHQRRGVLAMCGAAFAALILFLTWLDAAREASFKESTRRTSTVGSRR